MHVFQKVTAAQISRPPSEATSEKGDFGSCLQGYGKHLDEIHSDLDKEAERCSTLLLFVFYFSTVTTENVNDNIVMCRLVSLDSWLQVAAENVCRWHGKDAVERQTIAQLREEVDELRHALQDKQAFGSRKGVGLDEAQKQLQKLFSDYQELLREWEAHDASARDRIHKDNSRYERQILEMKQAMDTMVAEKIRGEQELVLQYEEKLNTLSARVKTLETENEAIAILRTQVSE